MALRTPWRGRLRLRPRLVVLSALDEGKQGRQSPIARNGSRPSVTGSSRCVSKGDFDTAYAAARQVAATPLPADRPASPGARFLLWDAKTLPARILIHRGLRGNANEAANSLPKPEDVQEFRKHSLAYWWIDGLRFALEAQRLINAGKLDEAREVVAALTQHGESMANDPERRGSRWRTLPVDPLVPRPRSPRQRRARTPCHGRPQGHNVKPPTIGLPPPRTASAPRPCSIHR